MDPKDSVIVRLTCTCNLFLMISTLSHNSAFVDTDLNFHSKQKETKIVRGSDYSPASELFARERQTMTGNNAKLDLVNVDAHKKIGQILTICS